MGGKRIFTLIELLLVVVILGALAAMVVPRLAGRAEMARKAEARAEIGNFETGLDMFELSNGRYPGTEDGLLALWEKPTWAEDWDGPYLKKKVGPDPWNRSYEYICPGEQGVDYDLYSLGSDGEKGTDDDITNW